MAKILFISPRPPWPLFSGGQIRVYHLLKALSKKHQIILAQYITEDETTDFIKELPFCYKIQTIKRRYKPWSFRTLFKSLFSIKPLLMNLYQNKMDMANLINWADLVWQECFYTADKIYKQSFSTNNDHKNNKKLILGEQNIEYLAYKRYFQGLIFWKKFLLWLPMRWDLIKMKYWEKKMWECAKKIVCVSEADKQIIEKESRRSDVAIISNGVDTEKFKPRIKIPESKTIFFTGEYKWFPNKEAIDWLVKEIFPKIKEKIPAAKLLIVGKHLPKWLRGLKDAGVDEEVADIRDAYKKADVFLAPLKSGSGTKYKILEAMAMGVPVVTTFVGAEGLEGFEGFGMIGEKTQDLVAATVSVLEKPQKYEIMTKKAREYVKEKFDWKIIGEKLERLIENL